jgi:hypothetical protein
MQLVKQQVAILYRVRHFLFLWVLCLGIHVSSFSQTCVKLRYERYTIDQGLSNNWVRDIAQDHLSYQGSATTPKASNFINSGAVIQEGPSPQVTGGGHAHLQVRTRREAKHISIEIEDNGPGIPDEIKDKILQPFFTTKKGTQGTGLGLSITHDIVKAHGGELAIQSQPGKTIFSLTLVKHHE